MTCGSPTPASHDRCPRCDSRLTSRTEKIVGSILADKYRIEEWVGSGGMCDVYRARNIVIGKQVAVKVLKPEFASDPKIASRFYREARAASRIRHPHAIDVMDFGIDQNETPFIVMEYVEGQTLSELLRHSGALTVERAANILRQACGALDVAHSVGVIHRDIKPDNILIAEYEGGDWIEVLDFGVAKIQEDVNRRAQLTGANFLIGTPRYMSPEQCEEKPVDARSDIYSLGVVLYEMLSGEAPFSGNSTRLLIAHAAETPPPLSHKRPDIPPAVEAVVMKTLDKNPERRPQSALDLAQEFYEAAGLLTLAETNASRSGAFSRVSVPLPEQVGERVEPSAVAGSLAAVELDNEETLVRRRMKPNPESPPASPAPDSQYAPAPPEESGASAGGAAEARHTTRDYRASQARRRSDLAAPATGGNYARRALIIGALALFLIAALIGYLAFRNKSAPADTSAGQVAGESSPKAAAQPQPSPDPGVQSQPEDGVESTPGPATPPPAPEEEAAETRRVAEQAPKVDLGEVRKRVVEALGGWASSLERRNLNAHVSHYMPTLHTYYLKRGVSRGYVRADRARALSIYDSLKFDFNNIEVRVDPSGENAVATFDKSWDFKGEKNSAGSVRERVWLRHVGGTWRIAGERDLKVHYLRGE
jgi:serine/threonine-protein kinase